jgi:hypothetical protein
MSANKLTHSLVFFLKHSFRDTRRRKCHFFLALCSVLIVVLFSLVINTIVARGPIIFLKMAEANNGEIDGIVTPSQSTALGLNVDQSGFKFLNYTRIRELYGESTYSLAPRKSLCGLPFGSDMNNPQAGRAAWLDGLNDTSNLPSRQQIITTRIILDRTVCLLLLDTKIERKYQIGRSYKYEPLKYGECVVNEKWRSSLNVDEND